MPGVTGSSPGATEDQLCRGDRYTFNLSNGVVTGRAHPLDKPLQRRSKDSRAFDMEKNPPLPSLFALCGNHTGRMKKRLLHPERFEAGSRLEWPMSRDSPPVSSCIRHSVSIDTGSFSPPTLSSDTE
ncbi:hypothetical protein TNCV_634541 [Trichonephila clavipes]|nr:hypothetical protein TNCV_634541 [Trichonephila clavipes]